MDEVARNRFEAQVIGRCLRFLGSRLGGRREITPLASEGHLASSRADPAGTGRTGRAR